MYKKEQCSIAFWRQRQQRNTCSPSKGRRPSAVRRPRRDPLAVNFRNIENSFYFRNYTFYQKSVLIALMSPLLSTAERDFHYNLLYNYKAYSMFVQKWTFTKDFFSPQL